MKILDFPDSAYLVSLSNYTLYSGVAAATLTPLADEPTEDFRLEYNVSGGTANTGTITATGTLNGAAKTETITFTGARIRQGQVIFDTISSITITGLADEATKPTIIITCMDLEEAPIQKETLTAIKMRFEHVNKGFWGPGGVWTEYQARAFVTNASIEVNSIIRFGSIDYIVKAIAIHDLLGGSELFRTLWFDAGRRGSSKG